MNKFAWPNKKQCKYLEEGILRHLHKERLRIISVELNEFSFKYANPARCLNLGCGDEVLLKHFSCPGKIDLLGCDEVASTRDFIDNPQSILPAGSVADAERNRYFSYFEEFRYFKPHRCSSRAKRQMPISRIIYEFKRIIRKNAGN